MNNVFGLDIGTRNVVGTVGYRTEDEKFVVIAQYIKEHETRAMLDGQIHDIGRVARTVRTVKEELEKQISGELSEVCIAAAGRVLKTVTIHVEFEYPEESVVTGEDVHTLHLLGVEKAQEELKETNDTRYKFYCVGYSVVKYYLNDEIFISLEGHKAAIIGCDIIVTFLPEDVVDGLYSAVAQADLSVGNMTLEPIAAINVAIPETFRMLNIALVDVGAGTSDICITKDGSIIAYGMIPHAGDELTDVIVQHYLVDFKTAEKMKRQSTELAEITYEDIMCISHTIPSTEIWELIESSVEKIATEVADKIRELNGNKSVSACFIVGGGGKVHGFTELLADKLGLQKERVALRGEEVLRQVTFQQEDIKKDPLLVTPIGICMNYYQQRNNFIMVRFNGERLKLYDNSHLTIVDAAMAAEFPNEQIFPKRGKSIQFTVNGASRIARGEAGEPAVITMNGRTANINTPLEPNSEVIIDPSVAGADAVYTVGQLEECKNASISFTINGKLITCPKYVQVNGRLEPGSYQIKDGDQIETRNYYTVAQIAEFMDVEVDADKDIFVNNREADFDTLVYDNFTMEWSVLSFGVADEPEKQTYKPVPEQVASGESFAAYEENKVSKDDTEKKLDEKSDKKSEEVLEETVLKESVEDVKNDSQTNASITAVENAVKAEAVPSVLESGGTEILIFVNGEPVRMTGKDEYIFVDIFDRITFDLNAGRGRAIATILNGRDALFTEQLRNGDKVELYWKEK